MADQEQLRILQQGPKAWNAYRKANPDVRVDLTSANLVLANLTGADLSWANLSEADLSMAHLRGADLRCANLFGAKLFGADLSRADLYLANLFLAGVSDADLINALLFGTHFGGADLSRSNLREAALWDTVFSDVDLSNATGLDQCEHHGPSTLDYRTLAKNPDLPLEFLRGCGLPDSLIENRHALIGDALQFYSCFISHSSKDQDFAERLYNDLQGKGVRSWYAPHDLRIGAKTRPTIHATIRVHDKLLLVLSEHSVQSQRVEDEVETALASEREQNRLVLFPIRLDTAVMKIETGWPALVRNSRNIGDFTRWKNHSAYQKAFRRLLRDLRASDATPTPDT